MVVQGVDENLAPVHAPITRWFDNGVRPVYRLKLRNGSEIKATADHQFLTERGWRRLGDLRQGDFVGTPHKLGLADGGQTLSDAERARLRVLGYLLADGGLSSAGPPAFYSSSASLIRAFEEACAEGFADLSLAKREQLRGVTRISAGRDRVTSGGYHAPSSLERWLRRAGSPLEVERLPLSGLETQGGDERREVRSRACLLTR